MDFDEFDNVGIGIYHTLHQLSSGNIENLLYGCLQVTSITSWLLSYIEYRSFTKDRIRKKIFDQWKFQRKIKTLRFFHSTKILIPRQNKVTIQKIRRTFNNQHEAYS